MRKAAGLDVNGWRDRVARSWSVVPGEGTEVDAVHVGAAGPLTSVVEIGEAGSGRWIGGVQADLAPHGRGEGWGANGMPARRCWVRDLLEGAGGAKGGRGALAAAIGAFARRADHTVLAIDDGPGTTEAMQERLLDGMAAARCGRPTLVWRTVLAALHAIETGRVAAEGTIGVVSHVAEGLSVQKLRIRAATARGGLLTPERRALAAMLTGEVGLRVMVAGARRAAVGPEGYSARTAHCATTQAVGRAALGLPLEPEIVRRADGGWEVVADIPSKALDPDLAGDLPDLSDCAQVFLETIAEGRARDDVESVARARGLRVDAVLAPDAVARGALVAARRMANGDPVYFDFLPRISTIVFGREGAETYDLIDEGETLEAGRLYRSPRPAMLAIPKGHSEVSVYLRKDAEARPRKATVTLGAAVASDLPVAVRVEQKPAAGRARIVMEASATSRSFRIDWDAAEEDAREWNEIVASLATPPPGIPERLVLGCGLEPWQATAHAPGMIELVAEARMSAAPDWARLAQRAMARPFKKYCVSSDGALPIGLPPSAERDLEEVVGSAMDVSRRRLGAERRQVEGDNGALQFLTWQFRRCPEPVPEWLLDCVIGHAGRTGTHPFVQTASGWVLVYQGLARTVRTREMEDRVLRAILDRDPSTWSWRCETACLGMLISRSETTPYLLSRTDVDRIVERIVHEMEGELGGQYTKLHYASMLAGGVLRYRLTEPYALLAGRDPSANRLRQVVEAIRRDLASRRNADGPMIRRRDKYVPILEEIMRFLDGEGGNPDILTTIYDA